MSTRAQQAQLVTTNEVFMQQVMGSLLFSASEILNEGDAVPDHINRLAWARAIIGNPVAQTTYFLPGVLTNATIAGEAGNPNGASGTPCPDGDIDYVVASLWNIYADQYAAQFNIGVTLGLGS